MTYKEFTSFLGEIENDFAKVRAALDAVERKGDAQAFSLCAEYMYQYKRRNLMRLAVEHANTRAVLRALADVYRSFDFSERTFGEILDGHYILLDGKDYISRTEYEHIGVSGDKTIWKRKSREATNE